MKKSTSSGLKNIEASTSGFVGFSSFTAGEHVGAGLSEQSHTAIDIVYSGDDGDFAVAMKKIGKKDETTKIKAMQDILAALPTRDKPTIKGFLGPWCTVFSSLAQHNDRRVRVAAFSVLEGLVLAGMKKSFAPYLPAILPSWWICCQDPAREVASLADTALGSLLGHGRERIAAIGRDHLGVALVKQLHTWLQQDYTDISDMRTSSEEEARERCGRTHACSLHALASVLQTLNAGQEQGGMSTSRDDPAISIDGKMLLSAIQPVFADKVVWKHVTSKSPAVRKAAYVLAASCANIAPAMLAVIVRLSSSSSEMPVLYPRSFVWKSVLHACLGESNGSLQVAAWDAVLALTRAFPSAWGVCPTDEPAYMRAVFAASTRNSELPLAALGPAVLDDDALVSVLAPAAPAWDLLWPRLLDSLRHSGHGAWLGLYPGLLPLLASLPVRVLLCPEGHQGEDPAARAASATTQGGNARPPAPGRMASEESTFAYMVCKSLWAGLKNTDPDELLPGSGVTTAVQSLGEVASASLLAFSRPGAESACHAVAGYWPGLQQAIRAAASVLAALICIALQVDINLVRSSELWSHSSTDEALLTGAEKVMLAMGPSVTSRDAVLHGARLAVVYELQRLVDVLSQRNASSTALTDPLEGLLNIFSCALSASCMTSSNALARMGEAITLSQQQQGNTLAAYRRFCQFVVHGLTGADGRSNFRYLNLYSTVAPGLSGKSIAVVASMDSKVQLVADALQAAAATALDAKDSTCLVAAIDAFSAEYARVPASAGQSPRMRLFEVLCPQASLDSQFGALHVGRMLLLLQCLRLSDDELLQLAPSLQPSFRACVDIVNSDVTDDGVRNYAEQYLVHAWKAGIADNSVLSSTIVAAHEQGSYHALLLATKHASFGGDALAGLPVVDVAFDAWRRLSSDSKDVPLQVLHGLWARMLPQLRHQLCSKLHEDTRTGVRDALAGSGRTTMRAAAESLHLWRSVYPTLLPTSDGWTWPMVWRACALQHPPIDATEVQWTSWAKLWAELILQDKQLLSDALLHDALMPVPTSRGGTSLQATVPVRMQHIAALMRAAVRLVQCSPDANCRFGLVAIVADPLLLSRDTSVAKPEASLYESAPMMELLEACLNETCSRNEALHVMLFLLLDCKERYQQGTLLCMQACIRSSNLRCLPQGVLWDHELHVARMPSSPDTTDGVLMDRLLCAAWNSCRGGSLQQCMLWSLICKVLVANDNGSGGRLLDVVTYSLQLLESAGVEALPFGSATGTHLQKSFILADALVSASAWNPMALQAPSVVAWVMTLCRHMTELLARAVREGQHVVGSLDFSGLMLLLSVLRKHELLPAGSVSYEIEVLRRLLWVYVMATLPAACMMQGEALTCATASAAALILFDREHFAYLGKDEARLQSSIADAEAQARDAWASAQQAEARGLRSQQRDGQHTDSNIIIEDDDGDDGLDVDAIAGLRRLAAEADAECVRVKAGAQARRPLVAGFHPSALPAPPPPAVLAGVLHFLIPTAVASIGRDPSLLQSVCILGVVLVSSAHATADQCPGAQTWKAILASLGPSCQELCNVVLRDTLHCAPVEDCAFALLELLGEALSAPPSRDAATSPDGSLLAFQTAGVELAQLVLAAESISAAHAANVPDAATEVSLAAPGPTASEASLPVGHSSPSEEAPPESASLLGWVSSTVTSLLGASASASVAATDRPSTSPLLVEEGGRGSGIDTRAGPASPAPPASSNALPSPCTLPSFAFCGSFQPDDATVVQGTALLPLSRSLCDTYDVLTANLCVGSGPGRHSDESEFDRLGEEKDSIAAGRSCLPKSVLQLIDPDVLEAIDSDPPLTCFEIAVELVSNIALGHHLQCSLVRARIHEFFKTAERVMKAYLLSLSVLQSLGGAAEGDSVGLYLCNKGPSRTRDGSVVQGQSHGGSLYRMLEACAHLVCTSEGDGNLFFDQPRTGAGGVGLCLTAGNRELAWFVYRLLPLVRALLLRCCDILPLRMSEWHSLLPKSLADEVSGVFSCRFTPWLFAHQATHLKIAMDGSLKVQASMSSLLDVSSRTYPRVPLSESLDGCANGLSAFLPARTPQPSTVDMFNKTKQEFSVLVEDGSREVVAAFSKEEARLAVRLILPPTYPLKRPTVVPETRTGISEAQWRRIELQLGKRMTAREGSLADALAFFAGTVDREFEGLEPCPICYCTLDPRTNKLPKTICPTCKNCFHKTCLLRWFATSKENKCPLCRQPFRQVVQ